MAIILCIVSVLLLFLNAYLRGWGGEERKEGKNPKQAPHCQGRAQHGAQSCESRDHDLSLNQMGHLTE